MMEYIEKLNAKKEYEAPQMEVLALDVQGTPLCASCQGGDDCGIVEVDNG